MSLVPNKALEGAAGNQGYKLERSLRFRSSASAYLSRTPAASSNQQKWTWSGWAKIGALGGGTFFAARTGVSGTYTTFSFYGNNQLVFQDNSITALQTAALFRDTSAWYHFVCSVDTTQATQTNRIVLYVNGVQVSWSTGSFPTQNANLNVNSTATHLIGQQASGSYLDGYLAEVNFIDGQALAPSSFGQTDPVTGVWTPKKYTGTYGTNGFYLNFSDNTSATTLAYDKSGNGNNWTPNNISTTAGATYDSMTDVPTLTSATAANYCVLNPLASTIAGSFTLSAGNLNVDSTAQPTVLGTFAIPSSKYYFEATVTNGASSVFVGIENDAGSNRTAATSGGIWLNGASSQTGLTSWSNNDIIGVAVDGSANTVQFYRNGSTYGTQVTYTSSVNMYPYYRCGSTTTNAASYNFGQRPFSYTPPTGFKALNTFNLPDPTIKKPNQYMDIVLRNGAGGTGATYTSLNFQPDFLWEKSRNQVWSNYVFDSVRGPSTSLITNDTSSETTTPTWHTSFNSNGFSVGTADWGTAVTLVDWCWKESATAGFDIVTYTGNGTAGRTVNHSLGVAPSMIIVKGRSNADNWQLGHTSVGWNGFLYFNLTNAYTATSSAWNNTAPTSTVFSLGSDTRSNGNGTTYVAYLFSEIAGFSKFGSYTGNGSTDGPFCYTGFQPRYLMIKRIDSAGGWLIKDTARSAYNAGLQTLIANGADAEGNGEYWDALSNGFKVRDTSAAMNTSGGTYIYAAFASSPFKFSNGR